jgi:hypothetical protein
MGKSKEIPYGGVMEKAHPNCSQNEEGAGVVVKPTRCSASFEVNSFCLLQILGKHGSDRETGCKSHGNNKTAEPGSLKSGLITGSKRIPKTLPHPALPLDHRQRRREKGLVKPFQTTVLHPPGSLQSRTRFEDHEYYQKADHGYRNNRTFGFHMITSTDVKSTAN